MEGRNMPQVKRTTVTGCARCGMEHKNLKFERLSNPADEYNYWSICPNTGQHIFIRVFEGPTEPGNKRGDDPRQTRPL